MRRCEEKGREVCREVEVWRRGGGGVETWRRGEMETWRCGEEGVRRGVKRGVGRCAEGEMTIRCEKRRREVRRVVKMR